jgi:superfamily II DNA or RNA helicase
MPRRTRGRKRRFHLAVSLDSAVAAMIMEVRNLSLRSEVPGEGRLDAVAEDLRRELGQARREVARLRADNERLRGLVGLPQSEAPILAAAEPTQPEALSLLDARSLAREKVALVRSLFRGREDVHALRWESARTGRAGYSPAVVGGWAGAQSEAKTYRCLTDEVIEEHLRGRQTVGIYPLLRDDTCWFLACDFDGRSWALDALAFLEVCGQRGVPAALERSRSGEGAHVWIFFAASVAATVARRLGVSLLWETMTARGEMDLASYDRFFPSQDFLPKRGFGNLIALPLQATARALGNTVFLDPETLEPWPDQWTFLSGLRRLSAEALAGLVASIDPVSVGRAAVERMRRPRLGEQPPPAEIPCAIGASLSIAKAGLPPSLLAAIKHLASLHNPAFYERERLRLSTHQTPRFIRCYEEDISHLHLPRGLLEELRSAVESAGSKLVESDMRRVPPRLPLTFRGSLTPLQAAAVEAMLAHEQGVLVAPPGTGKTVMACAVIAERGLPTLVLVHRKPLLEQWRTQLASAFDLPPKEIGQLGAGRRKRSGGVDLAMIQSLKAADDLEELFQGYGLIVVDECHHLPAVSFEACLRRAPVRYVLGLTATPYRRDGLEEIITMQCGPVRHRISARQAALESALTLELKVRKTAFTAGGGEDVSIQEIFRALVHDEARAALVCGDVLDALAERRRCLVLSHWKEHCRLLAERLRAHGKAPLVLEGGLPKQAREALLERIRTARREDDLVVIATGQYLGEGFDCPELDTLFLAFPISFKGSLIQYTGRLLRAHEGKHSVRVYDYADLQVPVLSRMHARRLKNYKSEFGAAPTAGLSRTEESARRPRAASVPSGDREP